jgi:hypothetical protein
MAYEEETRNLKKEAPGFYGSADNLKVRKYRYFIKSEEKIQKSLNDLGYIKNYKDNWHHGLYTPWYNDMWRFCEKELVTCQGYDHYMYLPEWIEKREV